MTIYDVLVTNELVPVHAVVPIETEHPVEAMTQALSRCFKEPRWRKCIAVRADKREENA